MTALIEAKKRPAADKPKPISAKIRKAIQILVAGEAKNITDAADKVGICREYLSRQLNRPHIHQHMRQKVERNLAIGAARAGATKLALLDSPNEMVKDRASSFILGLAGISPDRAAEAPGGRKATPGLQIVIMMDSGQQRVVAGPMEPRLIECASGTPAES